MSKEIITVKQLPVIVEQLHTIKAEVSERVADALSLVCDEDTVKEVKKARADLNAEFKGWEENRKKVKKAIMSPYEQFESVYKECITDVYKLADTKLSGKINDVEWELKDRKKAEIVKYFEEYRVFKNIDFITFDMAGINITLSASTKSLKDAVKAFVDRVGDDLILIDTQEYKDEILCEYMLNLNASAAITRVIDRHKAIEAAKVKREEIAQQEQAVQVAEKKVEAVAPPEEVLTVAFKVTATRDKLKALKTFLNNGGYDYT